MRMFEAYDPKRTLPASHANFFRTVEEAITYIDGCKMGDRDGEHNGPDYLSIRIVERDSHPCVICSGEVTSKDPETYPYCRNCYYTGAVDEHQREGDLDWFVDALGCRPTVEHTGGGCFWLAFYFEEGNPSYYVATDGEASLPDDWKTGWGYVGRHYYDPDNYEATEAHPDYEGRPLHYEYVGDADGHVQITREKLVELILADRRTRHFEAASDEEIDALNASAGSGS